MSRGEAEFWLSSPRSLKNQAALCIFSIVYRNFFIAMTTDVLKRASGRDNPIVSPHSESRLMKIDRPDRRDVTAACQ